MPAVSVLMPVFNASRYLRKAVDSILAQSFEDFEIIAVNDGSTDDSLSILKSYVDPRIIVVNQDINRGIVQTLNAGLAVCMGKFIARMDADDIALADRLMQQTRFLEDHPETGVIDAIQTCIDEADNPTGEINSLVVKAKDILETLPKQNCLGHPSVMVRGELLRQYLYRATPYEDYDLWLRMAADGIVIEKLATPLLLFREHSASITGADHAGLRHFLKIILTKRFYLSQLTFIDSLKPFNLRIRAWLLRDIAIHAFKKTKTVARHLNPSRI